MKRTIPNKEDLTILKKKRVSLLGEICKRYKSNQIEDILRKCSKRQIRGWDQLSFDEHDIYFYVRKLNGRKTSKNIILASLAGMEHWVLHYPGRSPYNPNDFPICGVNEDYGYYISKDGKLYKRLNHSDMIIPSSYAAMRKYCKKK